MTGVEQAQIGGYLTILRTPGPVLAKRWQPDGSITSYDQALQFHASERAVANLAELAAVLAGLQDEPRSAVIRGRFVGAEAAQKIMARLIAQRVAEGGQGHVQPGAVFRRGELFRDHPCSWIMLDVDGFEPTVDPLVEPEQACKEFISTSLPEAFHGVSFYWSLSGSAGSPKHAGKLKAHLWFWLGAPRTSADLRAWAMLAPAVDKSLFSPVQLHYTAAPIFFDDTDRVPLRSGLCSAAQAEVAELVIAEPAAREPGEARHGDRAPMKDPGDKPGIVGAFCRSFTPKDLANLLPDMFERGRDHRHFSWLGHDSPDGIYITTCGHGLVNVHDSAPSGQNRRLNVFDFVRLHQFGSLDAAIDEGTVAPSKRPSWQAMLRWIEVHAPEVLGELREVPLRHAVGEPRSSPEEDFAEGSVRVDHIISRLRGLPRQEVDSLWLDLARQLPRSERSAVIEEVAHLTGAKVRSLQDALREAQECDRQAEAAQAHLARVGHRSVINYQPENRTEAARAIEALIVKQVPQERYFSFGGQLSRIGIDVLPKSGRIDDPDGAAPPVPQIEPLNEVDMLELVETVAVLEAVKSNGPCAIGVPSQIIKILLGKTPHACAVVVGLVTHPIVLHTGQLVRENGLHHESGLYFNGVGAAEVRPYRRPEAEAALRRLRDVFLVDFHFRSELDEGAALAALFTGVQRRVLDIAPGVAVLASGQSSGKTTLARRIHLVLTGHDMPVMAFPEGNDEEVSKQLLATLLRSPAAICLDNLVDGTTFRSGCLAAALTGPQFSKRILGESRVATCPTNTLFMLTGNNIALGADEVTRWLSVRLATKSDRPDQRVFTHPDVVKHALAIRDEVLRDVVGIVAGYLNSGAAHEPRSRFPQWDRMVRQSIIWAGGVDVAEVFTSNTEQAEETQAYRGLLHLLHEVFGTKPFTAGKVANLARCGHASGSVPFADFSDADEKDQEADNPDVQERARLILGALRSRDPTKAESVGRVLQAALGRPVAVGSSGLLVLTKRSRDGYSLYQIEPA